MACLQFTRIHPSNQATRLGQYSIQIEIDQILLVVPELSGYTDACTSKLYASYVTNYICICIVHTYNTPQKFWVSSTFFNGENSYLGFLEGGCPGPTLSLIYGRFNNTYNLYVSIST